MAREDDFNNLVRKEVKRIKHVMSSLPAPLDMTNTRASYDPMFERIERRARVSVMGKMASEGEVK